MGKKSLYKCDWCGKVFQRYPSQVEGKNYSKLYGALEDREVAAKMLGRDLKPGEVVHHMDFNIRNPEPANLMIFPSNSAHTKYHNALRRFFDDGTLPQEPIVEVTE